MKLMENGWFGLRQIASWVPTLFAKNAKRMGQRVLVCAVGMALAATAMAQAVSTTTVQGTVYLANGQPGAGTLVISWPAFTTAAGQAVAADSTTVNLGPDGFVSVNLAPNVGAIPAGEYYTAVYYMSDGTTSTQYWVVPAAAQASLAQVQAQVMPAAQAVQAVSKAYVDQAIAGLGSGSGLSATGGTLTGPLYLNEDPTQPLQAADKHYVDTQTESSVPLAGGNMTGALTTPAVNGVEAPAAGSAQTTLQAAMNAAGTNGALVIPPNYAGTDAFTNPNGAKVTDLRTTGAQQAERSVKEFGAVCDGVTDDTNALQAALSYANAHGVALTIPQGTCKTRTLSWHGESIGGLGKQVSALMGFPGQDVLESGPDAVNMLSFTRLHDLTITVDQSLDVSCTPAEGRAAAGTCQVNRPMEANSIFSPGGNGQTGTVGSGAAWSVGNCAIAMQATTGAGGNGLRVAEMENVEIATTGVDPMAAQYPGAHSTHTCGLYLAQWPQWSEFRNIDIRGLNTGVAIPALPITAPAGLNADSNRWQNVTIAATHAFTAAAGSNNVLDNVVALAGNSSATGEPPTGLVLDLNGQNPQQGWTVRNAVVMPTWNAVPPTLTVTAASGAVTAVTVGSEHGLGWDPYGASVPVAFGGLCTAQATAQVNATGAISGITVTQGGVGCSSTTTARLSAAGTWDTAAPVNLIGGQNMAFFAGNLLKGNGGYTVWNAGSSASYGTQLGSGGGMLPGGGAYSALVGSSRVGAAFQVDQFPGADIGAKIQACVNAVNASYGGTCDARNFTGNLPMGSNLTIATNNVAILLPCATITTANQIVVTAGTRNVALRGCALRGGTSASGSTGGTALAYTGSSAMVEVGDPTYAADTPGFHLDNVAINTTGAMSAAAQGLVAFRTQEMDLESLYFLGNSNQTGMTLDGTGNYTGGTFLDNQFSGFGTAVNAIGHQVTNPATTDWMNASTFVRLHIDCPTSGGNPISGTYGINLQQGDGNTFTGGDVEGCSTALHLGPNAQNNTIVGLRNENSTSQVVADTGSAYNNWMTGGTMFTGKLTDNGTRNSFLDTFHRSFNALNGDWYMSQQDATLTNHFRLGIGAGNERGLLNEIQTDYGYRWLYGFSDATGGQQLYQMQDLLNNVYRLQIQQWNPGQSSTNNQTALNAAGAGNVCFNCSTNSGTGGVTFASGGATPAAVGTVDKAGNAQFVGNLLVGGTTQSAGTFSLRNSADAEVDYYLWPGLTTSQKGSFTYKDWNGNSQWYMVKDASNNWALNSATGGLDSFKAYQNTNSGDTYIDASNPTGHIRLNFENGSGAETDIYSGSSTNLDAAFVAPNAIKFPGLAASSADSCLQIDNSGYITNTGSPCGSGSGSGGASGTINSANSGQIAYYMGNGTSIGGMSAVPLTSGGTGATSASGALANLGGEQTIPVTAYGAVGDCTTTGSPTGCTDNTSAIQAAINAAAAVGGAVYLPVNPKLSNGPTVYYIAGTLSAKGVSIYGLPGGGGDSYFYAQVDIRGAAGKDVFATGDPSSSGYAADLGGFVRKDFGIIVDNSEDVSSSNTHRKPGKTCSDLTVTSRSPVVASTECAFNQGDVGQNVSVTNGTNTLTATIISVPVTDYDYYTTNTATLSANWTYASQSNATIYVAIMGQSVSQRVGNYAFAYDNTSTPTANGPLLAKFENLNISSTSGITGGNNDCAFFFQGTQPYGVIWDNLVIHTEWGLLAVPQDGLAASQSSSLAGFGDTNAWKSVFLEAQYPWVTYNGGINRWEGGQIYSGANGWGPQILNISGLEFASNSWDVKNVEYEGPSGSSGGSWRVDGNWHNFVNTELTTANTGPAQWDATSSKCTLCNTNNLNITGYLNEFQFVNGIGTVNDTGFSNRCSNLRSANPFDGQQPSLPQSCSAVNSRQAYAFVHDSAFVANGDEQTPYNNQSDLWIWPQDIYSGGGVNSAGYVVADSTSETGTHLNVPSGGINIVSLNNGPNSQITIGQTNQGPNLPATKVHACAKMKLLSGGPGIYFTLTANGTNVGQVNPSLTSSWGTYCFDADLTSYNGEAASFSVGASGTFAELAWISVHPWPNAENVNGAVNATGFQVSGAPLGTGNLADWTDSGAGNGSVPMWNAATSQWAPGTLPSNVNSINGNGGAFTFTGAGVACAGTTCTVPGSASSGTVQTGSEYSPAFYNQSGSGTTLGGVAPFTGLGYWQANAPPAAATGAQIVSAIGATAVANATAAASFTGSLSGDVTGTQGATTVSKVNGGAVPISANVVATNASGQPTAATAHNESIPRSCTATNSGNAYSCSTSPTFTPAAGDTISIDFNAANTGTATLAVNGAAAATIKKWGNSSSLAANDVLAGHWISATYDGTNWQLEGQLGNANATEINGGAVPASAAVIATNSGGQPVGAATTGSGSVVLATSPTLSGTTLGGATTMQGGVTLQNGANANQTLAIQPGSSADQIGAVQFNNYSGAAKWQVQKDANNYLRVTDAANSLDRVILPANANTTINAGAGANAVVINNTSGSGTAGFIVYEGGSNYSTAALQVSGSGNTTATGYLQGKFIMGTGTMGVATGAAAGSGPTIACATSHTCDGVSGTVTLTTGTGPTTGTLATLSFPNTHSNQANCMVTTLSATGMITSNTWTESTTAITVTANTVLAASTAYTIKYWCGGY